MNHFVIFIFVFTILNTLSVFAGPSRTTYQAKIIKPDGYPLEATNVNFKFTILDMSGSCILYSETFSTVNMGSSAGLISFSLGTGVRTFPVSGSTFEQVFSNTTASLTCDSGGPATYSPSANDTRKIVMQFNDSNGWQTLPAMTINAVPYAMYANDSLKFSGKDITEFVQVASLPTCGVSEAMRFNGVGFSCIAAGGNGTVTSGSVITALGYTPADGASVTTLTSNVSSVSSTVASVSSTVFSVSSTVTSLQSSVAASFATITSSQWTTSGTNIFYNTGNIGIGTTTPVTKLDVSGGVRIGAESTTCAPALAGTLRYNASNVEYCNGTSWQAFGVSGAGLQSFNGSTSGTQSFATGTGGTAPNIATANGVHTLNIPLASTGSVTAGLISNTDYTTFTNKITSSAASIAQVLGYVPADNAASGTYAQKANNLSDLTNIATARTNLGLGTFATASSIDLGSASATGTLAIARLPSFSGDATIAAASNTIILSNSGVTAGTYTKVTVDAKGRVTSSSALASTDVTTALGYTPANSATTVSSQWNTSGTTINYMNGNVGIGTANPQRKLHISTSETAANTLLALENTDTTNDNGSVISFRTTTTGAGAGSFVEISAIDSHITDHNHATRSSKLSFWTTLNGTIAERMVINSTGNIGIGTNTPTAGLHLAAGTSSNASLKFTSGTLLTSPQSGTMEYDGFNFYLTDSTNTRRAIAANTNPGTYDNVSNINSSSNITMTPTGSVIVSSTTASTNSNTGALVVKGGLGVAGNIYTSGTIVTSSNIQGVSVTATSGMVSPYIYGSTVSGGALTLDSTTHSTKGNIYLAPNGGYVGLGTSAPTSLLTVSGNSSPNIDLENPNPSGVTYPSISISNYSSNSGGFPLFVLKNAGGSKSSPTAIGAAGGGLGSVFFQGHTGSGFATGATIGAISEGGFTPTSLPTGITFNTVASGSAASVERMRISNNGNVGIGTTGPQSKLQINTSFNEVNKPSGLEMFINGGNTNADVGKLMISPDGNMAVGGLMYINHQTAPSDRTVLNLGTTGFSGVPATMSLSNGNVGIGTTTPGAQLDISNSSMSALRLSSTAAGGKIWEFDSESNGAFSVVDRSNSVRRMSVASGDYITFYKPDGSTSVMHLTGTGNVGIGVTNPSAKLELASGTASLAPLKFTSGTLLSSAQSGSFEYDGFNFYVTDSTNTRRAVAANANPGTYDNVSNINSSSNITLTPTGSVVVSSTTASTNSSTGALVVKGGLGVAGNLNVAGTISGSAKVLATGFRANQGAPDAADSSTNGYAFGADGDTGMFSPGSGAANGVLAFYGNNAELMRITPSGAVGIGTTTPTEILMANGSINSNNQSNNFATGGVRVMMDMVNASKIARIGTVTGGDVLTGTQGELSLYVNSVEHMRLNASGNVGIGTSSPSQKLEVNGGIKITGVGQIGPNGTYGYGLFQNGTSTFVGQMYGIASGIQFTDSAGANTMTIKDGGNVGIGTTSPNSPLTVANANDGIFTLKTTDNTWLYTNWLDSTNTRRAWMGLDGTLDSFNINVENGTSKILLNGGNVGIGTTSPTEKLHVQGNSKVGDTASTGTVYMQLLGMHDTAGGSGFRLQFDRTNDIFGIAREWSGFQSPSFVIKRSDGNVGIGTSAPVSNLEVGSSSQTYLRISTTASNTAAELAFTNSGAADWVIGADGPNRNAINNGAFHFWKSGYGTAMLLDDNGYVGIGTTSPGYNLTVSSGNAGGYTVISNRNTAAGGQDWRWYSSSTGAPLGTDAMCFGTGACLFTLYTTGNATLAGTLTQSSDARLKRDISSINHALDSITKIEGVTYYWKDNAKEQAKQMGLIAQNVETVFPEAVKTDTRGFKSVAYQNLVAPIINALREIRGWMFKTDDRIHLLEIDNAKLKQRNADLEAYLCTKDPTAPFCKKDEPMQK